MSLLRAQSLDNVSPDPFAIDGKLLSEEQSADRERVASNISRVTGSNIPDYESPTVVVWVQKDVVVARVLGTEKDRAGRGAPIVGFFQRDGIANIDQAIADDFKWFTQAIGRTIPLERLDELSQDVKDSSQIKKVRKIACLMSILITVIDILSWLLNL